jgi:hypothetical protein
MVPQFFNKLSEFAGHHQVFVLLLTGFAFICASWSVEKILENFVFTDNSLMGYMGAIVGSLSVIWVIRHFVTCDK